MEARALAPTSRINASVVIAAKSHRRYHRGERGPSDAPLPLQQGRRCTDHRARGSCCDERQPRAIGDERQSDGDRGLGRRLHDLPRRHRRIHPIARMNHAQSLRVVGQPSERRRNVALVADHDDIQIQIEAGGTGCAQRRQSLISAGTDVEHDALRGLWRSRGHDGRGRGTPDRRGHAIGRAHRRCAHAGDGSGSDSETRIDSAPEPVSGSGTASASESPPTVSVGPDSPSRSCRVTGTTTSSRNTASIPRASSSERTRATSSSSS